MKFMMIVKANESDVGHIPDPAAIAQMTKYNEELAAAGVLVELGGLQPSSKSVRVHFKGKQRTVIDGPFAEAKEVIAGFWLLECNSLAECIEWAKRCPNPNDDEGDLEIRPLYAMDETTGLGACSDLVKR